MESLARGTLNETGPDDLAPRPPDRSYILTVNGGSSSLKFALVDLVWRALGRVRQHRPAADRGPDEMPIR